MVPTAPEARVAKMAKASVLETENCGFESRPVYHIVLAFVEQISAQLGSGHLSTHASNAGRGASMQMAPHKFSRVSPSGQGYGLQHRYLRFESGCPLQFLCGS